LLIQKVQGNIGYNVKDKKNMEVNGGQPIPRGIDQQVRTDNDHWPSKPDDSGFFPGL
jgi:hypothetical protein